jgi:hypothetical protein
MAKYAVEILDEDGNVTGRAEAHECVGDQQECETPAVCEDHGCKATPENPVYTFVLPDGFFGAACRNGMDGDFSRLVEL